MKICTGSPGMLVQITTTVTILCPHNAQKCVSHNLQHFLDNFSTKCGGPLLHIYIKYDVWGSGKFLYGHAEWVETRVMVADF